MYYVIHQIYLPLQDSDDYPRDLRTLLEQLGLTKYMYYVIHQIYLPLQDSDDYPRDLRTLLEQLVHVLCNTSDLSPFTGQ